ncbi:MAG: helix-turn-helix transcriptional regulator [Clostridia bacterium]|nr:helix-turn-helix transcriptional regulator [Clostridia bacterium]
MPFPIENIKKLCDEHNTDFKNVETALGFGNSTISRWENAKKLPPYDRVKKVADFFGVTVSELSNGAYPDPSVSEDKKTPATESDGLVVEPYEKWLERDLRLLMWFRSLPPEKQKAILISQDAPEGLV